MSRRGKAAAQSRLNDASDTLHMTFMLVSACEFTVQCISDATEDQVKSIMTAFQLVPGVRFDWNSRPPQWAFPILFHDQLYAILEKMYGVIVHPLPQTILTVAREKCRQINDAGGLEAHISPRLEDFIPEHILMQLAPFQKQGVEFILRNEGRALLADDMGLGKTRTSVAAAVAYTREWPVLVVCPSSARHNWNSELTNMLVPVCLARSDVLIVESASQDLSRRGGTPYKFMIISYNLIQKLEARLKELKFGIIICDECHYLKNSRANRTKVLVPILKDVKRVILISGTPALSRPMELFTQLNALNKKAWPDEKEFGKRYCRTNNSSAVSLDYQPDGSPDDASSTLVSNNSFHTEFKGASNTQELHVMLTSTLMIRRLKKDILQSLPSKQREVIRVEVQDETKREELRRLLALFKANEESKESGNTSSVKKLKRNETSSAAVSSSNNSETSEHEKMSLLLQLFTQSGEAKLPGVLQHIKKFLDDPNSGKILIFAHHRVVMDAIAQYLDSSNVNMIRIDGQTSGRDRHESTRYFQNEPSCRVGLLAITAAGISITLTAASTVFFAEMFWTPGSLIQAEDRAHRIGQRNIVKVKYFLADNTVDDVLWPLVKNKVRTLGEVVEGALDSGFVDIEGDSSNKVISPTKGGKRSLPSNEPTITKEIYDLTKDLGVQELESARTLAAAEEGGDCDELDTDSSVVIEDDFVNDGNIDDSINSLKEPDVFAKCYMTLQNKKLNDGIILNSGSSDNNITDSVITKAKSTATADVIELLDSDSEENDAMVEVSNAEAVARRICERLIKEGKMNKSQLD
jgi:SWI/SNF-related matrix-associated actin-dependent regulator of chromatin subfamily A-like protein 1